MVRSKVPNTPYVVVLSLLIGIFPVAGFPSPFSRPSPLHAPRRVLRLILSQLSPSEPKPKGFLSDVMIAQLLEAFVSRRPKEPRTKPSETASSPGTLIGPFGRSSKGRSKFCWQANGVYTDQWDSLADQITKYLDGYFGSIPGEDHITISLYMIGESVQAAVPTVVFISKSPKSRKDARKAMKESGILTRYSAFGTAYVSKDPGSNKIEALASYERRGRNTATPSISTEVFFDASKPVSALGLPVYVRHSSSFRTATANAIRKGDQIFYQTVYHAFCNTPSTADESGFTTDDEFEVDSDTDSEMDVDDETSISITSVGSQSPDIWSNASSSGSGSSRCSSIFSESPTPKGAIHDPSPDTQTMLDSAAARLTPFALPHQNLELKQSTQPTEASLSPLGKLVWSAPERDLALIEITDLEVKKTLERSANQESRVFAYDHIFHSPKDDTTVYTYTASGGKLFGKLCGTPSYTRLPNCTSFQKVYTVRFNGTLANGDCGSAILDAATGETYGHLVLGCRTTGTAYVLAAHQAVEELTMFHNATGTEDIPPNEHSSHRTSRTAAGDTLDVDLAGHTELMVTPRPTRRLSTFDIFSFVINKFIGTGVFQLPQNLVWLWLDCCHFSMSLPVHGVFSFAITVLLGVELFCLPIRSSLWANDLQTSVTLPISYPENPLELWGVRLPWLISVLPTVLFWLLYDEDLSYTLLGNLLSWAVVVYVGSSATKSGLLMLRRTPDADSNSGISSISMGWQGRALAATYSTLLLATLVWVPTSYTRTPHKPRKRVRKALILAIAITFLSALPFLMQLGYLIVSVLTAKNDPEDWWIWIGVSAISSLLAIPLSSFVLGSYNRIEKICAVCKVLCLAFLGLVATASATDHSGWASEWTKSFSPGSWALSGFVALAVCNPGVSLAIGSFSMTLRLLAMYWHSSVRRHGFQRESLSSFESVPDNTTRSPTFSVLCLQFVRLTTYLGVCLFVLWSLPPGSLLSNGPLTVCLVLLQGLIALCCTAIIDATFNELIACRPVSSFRAQPSFRGFLALAGSICLLDAIRVVLLKTDNLVNPVGPRPFSWQYGLILAWWLGMGWLCLPPSWSDKRSTLDDLGYLFAQPRRQFLIHGLRNNLAQIMKAAHTVLLPFNVGLSEPHGEIAPFMMDQRNQNLRCGRSIICWACMAVSLTLCLLLTPERGSVIGAYDWTLIRLLWNTFLASLVSVLIGIGLGRLLMNSIVEHAVVTHRQGTSVHQRPWFRRKHVPSSVPSITLLLYLGLRSTQRTASGIALVLSVDSVYLTQYCLDWIFERLPSSLRVRLGAYEAIVFLIQTNLAFTLGTLMYFGAFEDLGSLAVLSPFLEIPNVRMETFIDVLVRANLLALWALYHPPESPKALMRTGKNQEAFRRLVCHRESRLDAARDLAAIHAAISLEATTSNEYPMNSHSKRDNYDAEGSENHTPVGSDNSQHRNSSQDDVSRDVPAGVAMGINAFLLRETENWKRKYSSEGAAPSATNSTDTRQAKDLFWKPLSRPHPSFKYRHLSDTASTCSALSCNVDVCKRDQGSVGRTRSPARRRRLENESGDGKRLSSKGSPNADVNLPASCIDYSGYVVPVTSLRTHWRLPFVLHIPLSPRGPYPKAPDPHLAPPPARDDPWSPFRTRATCARDAQTPCAKSPQLGNAPFITYEATNEDRNRTTSRPTDQRKGSRNKDSTTTLQDLGTPCHRRAQLHCQFGAQATMRLLEYLVMLKDCMTPNLPRPSIDHVPQLSLMKYPDSYLKLDQIRRPIATANPGSPGLDALGASETESVRNFEGIQLQSEELSKRRFTILRERILQDVLVLIDRELGKLRIWLDVWQVSLLTYAPAPLRYATMNRGVVARERYQDEAVFDRGKSLAGCHTPDHDPDHHGTREC